jgi:hypothetical protein
MRKMIAGIAAGLLLVAGQAAAAGSGDSAARVGDRVAAELGTTSAWSYNVEDGGWPWLVPTIMASPASPPW